MVIEIPKDRFTYKFSKYVPPAAYARPGDVVVFEVMDNLSGQIRSEETPLEAIDIGKRNPCTGPLYVEGAEAGDTLVVDILDVKVGNRGWIRVFPGGGALHDKNFQPKIKIVSVEGGYVTFNNLKIPIKPMVGTIGVAPTDGEIPTPLCGPHGGNMDLKILRKGTRIYLPVFADGALLAMGDLHAVQSDGESGITPVEVDGEVMVRLEVIKGRSPTYPVVELEDTYSIITSGTDLDEAVYRAVEESVKVLMKALNTTFQEAYMLSSILVELRINQVVNKLKGVRAELSKNYVSIKDLLS
ncbi:MAG: acetamidase/formamidase family protein [Sulfolobales archaeon]|nr:acetamidase/formamidase family protein [Sulfolobales archaeon]